jgi:membrane protease YdiL (CAAX protease family)
MDASGLLNFSALPLCPLMLLFWYLQRLPSKDIGFVWAHWRDYGLAAAYPLLVIGLIILTVLALGASDLSQTVWWKTAANLGLISVSTFLVAMITEEGFFRGWLWASLQREGMQSVRILICTSLVFALWHVSAVVFDTGFNPQPVQIPLFLVNAAVIGAVWGLMRILSGSIVVTSLSHGIWNAMAYVLFGFGKKVGALGVANTVMFGPEIGIMGLTLNILFAAGLFWWWKSRRYLAA